MGNLSCRLTLGVKADRPAVLWFAQHGVRGQALLSDNGDNSRSPTVAALLRTLEISHRWTRPYRPQTNGKAERFIRTLLHEWAYADPFPTSARRTAALRSGWRSTPEQHLR